MIIDENVVNMPSEKILQYRRKLYEVASSYGNVHIFNFESDVLDMLFNTRFQYNEIKLPFNIIKLDVIYTNKNNSIFESIYIMKTDNGFYIQALYRRNDGIIIIPTYNVEKNLKHTGKEIIIRKSDLFKKNEQTHEMLNSKIITNGFINFIGNCINYINSTDVREVVIDRRNKPNYLRRKQQRGQIPNLITHKIFLTGELRKYLNSLPKSGGKIEYSHKFWVRGHWRTLRSYERYGDNVGKMLWIMPFIKGRGELVKKDYLVKDHDPRV